MGATDDHSFFICHHRSQSLGTAHQRIGARIDEDRLDRDAFAAQASERRQQVNTFFLSINTGACALIGYLFSNEASEELKVFLWLTPLAGILISYFWSQLIKSYRDLSTAKPYTGLMGNVEQQLRAMGRIR